MDSEVEILERQLYSLTRFKKNLENEDYKRELDEQIKKLEKLIKIAQRKGEQ